MEAKIQTITMTQAPYKIKYFIGFYSFRRLFGSMVADRHGTDIAVESFYLETISTRQRKLTGNALGF